MNKNCQLIKSVDYFMTFTLKPLMYSKVILYQMNKGYEHIEMLFDSLKFEGLCVFELTKGLNVHFHALGNFNTGYDVKDRILPLVHDFFRKSKIIGRIDIQQCIDWSKTYRYLLKDHDETKTITTENPILYNCKKYSQQEYFCKSNYDLETGTEEEENEAYLNAINLQYYVTIEHINKTLQDLRENPHILSRKKRDEDAGQRYDKMT